MLFYLEMPQFDDDDFGGLLRNEVGDLGEHVGERDAVQAMLGTQYIALGVVAHAHVEIPCAGAELGSEIGRLALGEILADAAPKRGAGVKGKGGREGRDLEDHG